jgi:uncharacterized protein
VPTDISEYSQLLSNGEYYEFYHPERAVYDIEVIAHALSNLCRFNGHGLFYSVAQHSVLASQLVHSGWRMGALMHDAAEAFIGDVTRGLKHMPEMALYRRIEDRVEADIARRFGLVWPWPPEVKDADNFALAVERRDIMPATPDHIWRGAAAYAARVAKIGTIIPSNPSAACVQFLERYHYLKSND